MKAVHLVELLFCMTLPLIAGLDIMEFISTAQCQSSCLRNLTIDDDCWTGSNIECQRCWETCEFLSPFENKLRLDVCKTEMYSACSSCQIACTFYRTHGTDEQYETTALPAPEEDNIINLNEHDVAVTLQNVQGIWKIKQHYPHQDIVMRPGDWIIITNETGAIKHYSWEKWQPTLQSGKKNGPLFQLNITWTDWQNQLEKQWENVTMFNDFSKFQKPAQRKPSFVVTWQEKTGNGIMGNQVADSESAQISVPSGEYLVRIATDDGPGSYPIVINTDKYTTEESNFPFWKVIFLIFSIISIIGIISIIIWIKKKRTIKKEECMNEINELPGSGTYKILNAISSNNDTQQAPQQKSNSNPNSGTDSGTGSGTGSHKGLGTVTYSGTCSCGGSVQCSCSSSNIFSFSNQSIESYINKNLVYYENANWQDPI